MEIYFNYFNFEVFMWILSTLSLDLCLLCKFTKTVHIILDHFPSSYIITGCSSSHSDLGEICF